MNAGMCYRTVIEEIENTIKIISIGRPPKIIFSSFSSQQILLARKRIKNVI